MPMSHRHITFETPSVTTFCRKKMATLLFKYSCRSQISSEFSKNNFDGLKIRLVFARAWDRSHKFFETGFLIFFFEYLMVWWYFENFIFLNDEWSLCSPISLVFGSWKILDPDFIRNGISRREILDPLMPKLTFRIISVWLLNFHSVCNFLRSSIGSWVFS